MKKKGKDQLTAKQSAFVAEYLIDLNATQAAIRAGYSVKGAAVTAFKLLTNANIQTYLSKEIQCAFKRAEISQDAVLGELKKIGFSNMAEYVKWGPNGVTVKDSKNLLLEQTACVSEVSETTTKEGGSIKFKLHSKEKALEHLGRYLKLFTDTVVVDNKNPPVVNITFSNDGE